MAKKAEVTKVSIENLGESLKKLNSVFNAVATLKLDLTQSIKQNEILKDKLVDKQIEVNDLKEEFSSKVAELDSREKSIIKREKILGTALDIENARKLLTIDISDFDNRKTKELNAINVLKNEAKIIKEDANHQIKNLSIARSKLEKDKKTYKEKMVNSLLKA